MRPITFRSVALAAALAAAGACRTTAPAAQAPAIIQPGAPGQTPREIGADQAADLSHLQATPADVAFMQGMISHHSQAVDMVELLKTRTTREDMRMLGKRIELSQIDEIGMMRHWLQARGQQAPDPQAMHAMAGMHDMHDMGDMGLMPGMLTQAEMKTLAAAKGAEFDRLFLEGMIKHHGGALTMVQTLLSTAGAAQDSEIFAFASDVEADQSMEIDRMSAMLKELQK